MDLNPDGRRAAFRSREGDVKCPIKCDGQWFSPNCLRLGEKIQETGLLVPQRLAMIGQWARLFPQLTNARGVALSSAVSIAGEPLARLPFATESSLQAPELLSRSCSRRSRDP